MAGHEQANDRLPEPPFDVIEAFLDGEAIDPMLLRRAMEDSAGRDHLVDLLLLREAVQGVDRAGWNTVAKPAVSSRTRWWAAAAAIVLSVGAGFVAGQRTLAATPPDVAIETAIEVPAAPAAPQPTRTISLQPGVNWTDVPGGK